MVTCCRPCNGHKANRLPSEWLGERITNMILRIEMGALAASGPLIPRRLRSECNPTIGSMFYGLRLLPEEIAALTKIADDHRMDLGLWMRAFLRKTVGLPSLLDVESVDNTSTYEQST